MWHKAVFLVGPSQGRSPDASGSPKNASGPVGRLNLQPMNLTPPTRVKAWVEGLLRPEVSPVMRHTRLELRSCQQSRPKRDPCNSRGAPVTRIGEIRLRLSLTCIYGGRVHYIGSTTQSHPCRRSVVVFLSHSWGHKRVHIFPKGINPKVNVIAWLEFELAYYDFAVEHVSHYATGSYQSLFISQTNRIIIILNLNFVGVPVV